MIYVEMYGRLGNQFFRYATAKALQKKYYPNEKIVINFTQINEIHKTDPSYYNVLNEYRVDDYEVWNNTGKVLFKETNIIQKILCMVYYSLIKKFDTKEMNGMVDTERKWQRILDKYGIYWYRYGAWNLGYSKQKNKFVSGNFECPQYFNDIKDDLVKEFTPKEPRLEKNKELYDKIESTESVGISIRRGDFESDKQTKALHGVCDKEYFMKAIEEIKKRVDNPVFILFSDDIEWAKANIQTGTVTFYEDGKDPVWEKLRMMSLCKHFILSNSTFSWWCQYLSTSENKIVISPSRWFNNDYRSNLIEDSFIKIKV